MDKAYNGIVNSIRQLAAKNAGLKPFPDTIVTKTLGEGLIPLMCMGDEAGNTLMVVYSDALEAAIVAYSYSTGKRTRDEQLTANSPNQLMADARKAIKTISDAKAIATSA